VRLQRHPARCRLRGEGPPSRPAPAAVSDTAAAGGAVFSV